MNIREAKTSEAILLSDLAFESKAYWGYSAEFMDACKVELDVSEQDICSENTIYQVYEKHGEIIAFYAIEHISDSEAELIALFVKPRFIGKGIGKVLMQHAVSISKNQGYRVLRIQGDPNAEKFYLSSGAIRIGEKESESIQGRYLPLFQHNLGMG